MKPGNTNINTNNADSLRTKYILGFALFFIITIILFIWNPYDLFTKYTSASIFISLFLGMFFIIMIVFYDYLFKHPGTTGANTDLSYNLFFILFAFLVSAGMIILLLWCLNMFSSDQTASSIGSFIINFLLLFVILSIVYKILIISSMGKSPLTRIILYSIFYIPCLFVNVVEMIMNEYKNTTKSVFILLIIEIILIIIYLIYPTIIKYFYTQGGKQIVNRPIPLDTEYKLATYQTLNNSDEYNYHYALSFWFFIDSMSPSTNSSYSYYTNILSYGDNPSIKYNGLTNSLLITVTADINKPISLVDETHKLENALTNAKDEEIDEIQQKIKQTINKVKHVPIIKELDDSGKRIVYLNKNVLLQKWNNIILNYNGGTLDIFYNGKLVKSVIEVVPYITYDTLIAGSNKGISGGIANIMYFDKPLDVFKINNLYNFMKYKDPPSLSNNNTIIS
jgi:hypothetical protein